MNTICNETPTARKTHQCMWCNRTIEPGEKYTRQFNNDGGAVWTWKNCTHCEAMAHECDLWALDYGNGIDYDTFRDFDPADPFEWACRKAWRWQWRHDNGTLLPIPARK